MPSASLGNLRVLSARIHEPRQGIWHATVEVDSSVDVTGRQTLTDESGAVTWVGTVARGGVDEGRWRGRLVGGAARLGTSPATLGAELPAKFYAAVRLGTLLGDVATETGETLSSTISKSDVLDHERPHWQRAQASAGALLSRICDLLGGGHVWRLDRAGEILIQIDAYPALAVLGHEIDRDPLLGQRVFAPNGGPTILPGVTFGDERVERVLTDISEGGLRQTYWVA